MKTSFAFLIQLMYQAAEIKIIHAAITSRMISPVRTMHVTQALQPIYTARPKIVSIMTSACAWPKRLRFPHAVQTHAAVKTQDAVRLPKNKIIENPDNNLL